MLDDDLRFVVFGRSQGKGSKRALPIRGKPRAGQRSIVLVDSNRNAAPWAAQVSSAAAQAMREANGHRPAALLRAGVVVDFDFYFARPRSHFGIGRNANLVRLSAPTHMVTMPDLDKLARCALDALSGIVFKDDAQVCELNLSKRYGEPERLEVCVHEL